MKMLLNMKAAVEKLQEFKCERSDIDRTTEIQQITNQNFRHVLIIFMELLDIQQNKASETKGA